MRHNFMQAIAAVEMQDLAKLEDALKHDASIAAERTDDGDTLLHLASWYKRLEMLPILIQCGSDVNAKGCYGRTPLHCAVHEGTSLSAIIYAFLLNHGALVDIVDDNGFTPLQWAQIDAPECVSDISALQGSMYKRRKK